MQIRNDKSVCVKHAKDVEMVLCFFLSGRFIRVVFTAPSPRGSTTVADVP